MEQRKVVDLVEARNEGLRDQLKAVVEDNRSRVTQARMAKETGLSATTISQWLSGTYPGDNASVEHKLQLWLAQYRRAQSEAATMPTAPGYVQTPTAERVVAALGYAQIAGDIAVVYGGAGLGKSSAVRRYAGNALNCWVATMTPASASVVTALEEIAEALGLTVGAGGAAKLHRVICRKVAESAGLLVIDEAQHLSIAALDQIRSIHDATGIGIALVGNEAVYARMTGGNRAAYLDRLYSRIGKRVRLAQSTLGDIDAILKAWAIQDSECRAQLVEIARRPGGLRGLTKVLRLAAMRAMAAGRSLCCADVGVALEELGGAA